MSNQRVRGRKTVPKSGARRLFRPRFNGFFSKIRLLCAADKALPECKEAVFACQQSLAYAATKASFLHFAVFLGIEKSLYNYDFIDKPL